jgi:ABC-type multidrug transport system fused ATPase/permease subunit
VFYAVIVAAAVGTISEVIGDLQRAAGATERLFEILEVQAEIRAPDNPVALPVQARGSVSFDHVVFRYPSRPDAPALDDFSLEIAAGEKVALVGSSGAARRRCSNFFCASTTRRRAPCASTVSTCAPPIRTRCAAASRSSPRTRLFSR